MHTNPHEAMRFISINSYYLKKIVQLSKVWISFIFTFPSRYDRPRPTIDNNAKLDFEKIRPSRTVALALLMVDGKLFVHVLLFSVVVVVRAATIHWPYHQVRLHDDLCDASIAATCCSFRVFPKIKYTFWKAAAAPYCTLSQWQCTATFVTTLLLLSIATYWLHRPRTTAGTLRWCFVVLRACKYFSKRTYMFVPTEVP